MQVDLNAKNLGYFVFNPSSPLLEERDRTTLLVLNIILAVCTAGLGHLICSIVYAVQQKEMSALQAKVDHLGQETLTQIRFWTLSDQSEIYDEAVRLAHSDEEIDQFVNFLMTFWKKPYRQECIDFAKHLAKDKDLLPIMKALAECQPNHSFEWEAKAVGDFYRQAPEYFTGGAGIEDACHLLSSLKEHGRGFDKLYVFMGKIPLDLCRGDSFQEKVASFFEIFNDHSSLSPSVVKQLLELCRDRDGDIQLLLKLFSDTSQTKILLAIASHFGKPDETIDELSQFLAQVKSAPFFEKLRQGRIYAADRQIKEFAAFCRDLPPRIANERLEMLELLADLDSGKRNLLTEHGGKDFFREGDSQEVRLHLISGLLETFETFGKLVQGETLREICFRNADAKGGNGKLIDLPLDINQAILSFLNVKKLVKYQTVCTTWKDVIAGTVEYQNAKETASVLASIPPFHLVPEELVDAFGGAKVLAALPILDIGDNHRDYLDFITPDMMSAPIMRGVDLGGRPFIAIKGLDGVGSPVVMTLFPRDPNSRFFVCCPFAESANLFGGDGVLKPENVENIRKLVQEKQFVKTVALRSGDRQYNFTMSS